MRRTISTVTAFVLALHLTPAQAEVTTPEILEATASVDCLDYRIKGICLKLKCGFFGCRVRARPWIEHRIPDLVVSAYDQPGEIPWTEARTIYGEVLQSTLNVATGALLDVPAGGGHATAIRPSGSEGRGSSGMLRFKEVSVIGNPAAAAFRDWLRTAHPLTCPTRVDPFAPYFASEADSLAWRTGISEQLYPETWSPASRPIGTFGDGAWGKVYPRQGQVEQHYDVLAAAVAAQRAVDVSTRGGQPHLYRRVPGISPSDEKTDQWQMIFPRSERQCRTFGRDQEYHDGRENSSGNHAGSYSWVYWPLHDCCPGSGILLGRIAF